MNGVLAFLLFRPGVFGSLPVSHTGLLHGALEIRGTEKKLGTEKSACSAGCPGNNKRQLKICKQDNYNDY